MSVSISLSFILFHSISIFNYSRKLEGEAGTEKKPKRDKEAERARKREEKVIIVSQKSRNSLILRKHRKRPKKERNLEKLRSASERSIVFPSFQMTNS